MAANRMIDILSTPHLRYLEEDSMEYIRGEEDDILDMALVTVFGEQKLKRLYVIVEMYDHKNYGIVKREFLKQFTPAERKVLSNWYLRIYAWFLRTGIPIKGVRMSMKTYILLCRFADFFATI